MMTEVTQLNLCIKHIGSLTIRHHPNRIIQQHSPIENLAMTPGKHYNSNRYQMCILLSCV